MSAAPPTTTPPSQPSPSEAPEAQAQEHIRTFVWQPDDEIVELESIDAIREAYHRPETRLWIDVQDATEPALNELAKCLELHHLVVEDIVERNQRPKVEYTGPTMHLVLFAMLYDGELVPVELDFVLGERFLLTSHPQAWGPLDAPNIERNGVAHYLKAGPDHMLWAVMDAVVDGYFPVFDKLGDEIDDLQDDVLRRPSTWVVERLFQVRRDLLTIRHTVSPEREVLNELTNRENPLIPAERQIYFRDVYDHLIRLTDELDSYRELVTTTLDAYLSTVNNNLSEIMKRLTSVTAVLAGAGVVAGIFGMSETGLALSFTDMRFWIVAILILISAVFGLAYFRRIGWI